MSDFTQEERDRRARVEALREAEINPFADRFERTHDLATARELPADTSDVSVAGRIIQLRNMGKLAFVKLRDQSGDFQIVLAANELGDNFKLLTKNLDVADFVGATGKTFVTKHGEPSLLVSNLKILTKALSPLPEKFHGLQDEEKKYRERYLDLATDRETLERFLFRSNLVSTLRRFFEDQKFIEVETPVLQTKPSGAVAKPFFTHHNALDIECSLRIAPETYLKRCLVGGFDRVFEFARCFRNEGIDPTHLQDFTMMELYVGYENYEFLIDLAEKMFAEIIEKVLGGNPKIIIEGKEVDLTPSWPRVVIPDAIKEKTGVDVETASDEELLECAKKVSPDTPGLAKLGRGNLIDAIYKKVVRAEIVDPTFVIGHPVPLSPFARRNDENPERCDRFQLVIAGAEVINAFSELADADDQKSRFDEGTKAKEAGDEEAADADDDFVRALSHGMPPAAGWGIGIDRLTALLTNQDNLKDVVLFPLMRPEK